MIKFKKGFTLVELIVVITILSILWTIAFISLQWYSQNSRDALRMTDIKNIKTSLEIFALNWWKYPYADNKLNTTFSWATVWSQWTIWKNVVSKLREITEIPVDPLTNNQYTYSVLNTLLEYEIWTIVESPNPIAINLDTFAAGNQITKALITWNYNWIMAKVSTWSSTYVLAVPTIISSEVGDILDIINQKKLVYDNYENLPSSYQNSNYDLNWWFDYSPSNIVVYKWDIDKLSTDEDERIQLLINIQESYSWTVISGIWNIKELTSIEININSPSEVVKTLSYNALKNDLKIKIDINSITTNESSGSGTTETTESPLIWPKVISWINNSKVKWIDVDSSGNIYVSWYYYWNTEIFWENHSSTWDWNNLFLAKINSSWNVIWIKTASWDLDVSKRNNLKFKNWYIYLVWDFQWTSNIFWENLASNWWRDIFVSKFDTNWNLIWSKWSWWNIWDDLWAWVDVDNNWNIYVAWYFVWNSNIFWTDLSVTNAKKNVFLSKLSSDWTFVWSKGSTTTSNADYEGSTVAVDSNNNIYIGWYFSQTWNILWQTFSTGWWQRDWFIVKVDSEGTLIWWKKTWSSSYEDVYAITIDSANNLIATWRKSSSNTNFWLTQTNIWSTDIYITKIDTNWNSIWNVNPWSTEWDGWYWIDTDNSWNVYAIWKFSWSFNNLGIQVDSVWSSDLYVMKTNSNWNLIWQKRLWWSINSEEWYWIAVTTDWKVYAWWYLGWNWDILWVEFDTSVRGWFITKVENN